MPVEILKTLLTDGVRQALGGTPGSLEEYREPLVLQVLMGYTTAEIGAELGLSTAAVLTRLFRARKQLRQMCGADASMDPEAPLDAQE